MTCQKCGAEIGEMDKVCGKCGLPVEQDTNTQNMEKSVSIQNPTYNGAQSVAQPFTVRKIGKILKQIASLVIAIVFIVVVVKANNPDNNILGIKSMREAYRISQDVIRDYIDTPKTAKFPKFEPEFVTQLTEDIFYEGEKYRTHTVSAYVDYDNIFGVNVRSKYVVKIGFAEAGDYDDYFYEICEFDW